MTEPELFSDDEIVSAYLDGEATPTERARVENDPRLQARLAELRVAARAVGTPHFFPDAPGRDELIARAVAASGTVASPTSGGGATVTDLGAARQRRTIVIALSAAAAVLLVLIAAPLALRDRSGDEDLGAALEREADDQDTAGAPVVGEDAESGDIDEPGPSEGNNDDGSATTLTPPTTPPTTAAAAPGERTPVDLGEFASRADAQVAVTAAIDGALAASAGDESSAFALAPGDAACHESVVAGDQELGSLVYAATFGLPDGRHQVLLYELPPGGAVNGTHRLYEVTVVDCAVVGVQTL
jgi:hypothetical protein